MHRRSGSSDRRSERPCWDVELDVIEGLADVVVGEVRESLSIGTVSVSPRSVSFAWSDLHALLGLRTPLSASVRLSWDGRRPSVLLGDSRLSSAIRTVLALHPEATFGSFSVDAPGEDSAAMRRVRELIAEHVGLAFHHDRADLLVRVRRSVDRDAWEALVRLTPRPLSARAWRVVASRGAVNAPLAAAMVRLSRPGATDRFVNLMCGSGTLLIERALLGDVRLAVGLDSSDRMLVATTRNVRAAGVWERVRVLRGDAAAAPFADGSFDAGCTVLPYGFEVGSHGDNVGAYPALLESAERLIRPGGTFVVLTQELNLIDRVLASSAAWDVVDRRRVWQGGHRPTLVVLERRA